MMAVLLIVAAAGCSGKDAGNDPAKTQQNAAQYLVKQVPEPMISSIGGEWTVIGLARADAEVPDGYYETYYDNVRAAVKNKKGILDERRYTEYARVSIALAAIGKDPTQVEGYNLMKPLEDYKSVEKQGLNGPVFALIAAGSNGYELKASDRYLNYILKKELPGGGFSLKSNEVNASADISAMVLQALAYYKDDEKVTKVIDRTVGKLAQLQKDDGTFGDSSETLSQVIIGLASAGVDPTGDKRFIKGDVTLYKALMTFASEDGFSHKQGGKAELMPTDQGLCALDAIQLFSKGSSLYEMK